MGLYVLRRLLATIPVLIAASFLTFTFVAAASDPLAQLEQQRNVNFVATHLANKSEGAGWRAAQILSLLSWLRGFSEQKIVAGDFNAGLSNLAYIGGVYDDGWSSAATVTGLSGTYSNGYRIDFVFHSETSRLTPRAAHTYDTRNAYGVRPSDHHPVLLTYGIN